MLLDRGGHYRASTSHLQQLFPGFVFRSFATLPREIWKMLLPIEHAPFFAREARTHGLDPYVLLALVRQESAFDPRAVSAAQARGLMQLIPPTARRVARQLRLDRFSIDQLFLPQLNIRLGSQYLADRLAQFQGNIDRAVASYNAGPDPVSLWLSEGDYREAAEFVENIPFTETRNYVKIFHRNYHLYKRLYGDEFRAIAQLLRHLPPQQPSPSSSAYATAPTSRFTGIINMDEQDKQDCLGESQILQFRASLERTINIDAQDIQDIQDLVLGVCSALIPGIRKSVSDRLAG